MRVNTRALLSVTAFILVLLVPSAASAQHKHTQSGQKKPGMAGMAGMKSEMSKMMQSPHHKLMMAYMKSMSAFASALREQAMKAQALDLDAARATVAELRHNLDAMEALHQKHMQTMPADMQSKMQMMMEKMDKDRTTLKDQVGALETDVQADKPDSKKVTADSNALLKHLGMMSKMNGSKAGKKMGMKKKMEMKKKPEMKM